LGPRSRGQPRLWNFDTVRLDFYRDASSHFEAFKKAFMMCAKRRTRAAGKTGYDFPAARDGRVVKEEFAYGWRKITRALVFNTRRLSLRRAGREAIRDAV